MIVALLLLLQLKVPDAQQFVGPPKGAPVAGALLHSETQRVAGLLRCPVCQGMSVADSPAEMAINMKAQVGELLARGYTEEQILEYFEKSYGQFVLLRPKSRVVWALPVIALLIGAVIVVMKIRDLEKPRPAVVAQDDAYLAKVRDLVGGGKS
ncbi:MAG TPA: cytochrome c-type biogenesis protein [Thermoanaerobaculia bacterium]|nr:cytochrome c-type biogenesis protein [Thermoanaerobaculia bacterium]